MVWHVLNYFHQFTLNLLFQFQVETKYASWDSAAKKIAAVLLCYSGKFSKIFYLIMMIEMIFPIDLYENKSHPFQPFWQ